VIIEDNSGDGSIGSGTIPLGGVLWKGDVDFSVLYRKSHFLLSALLFLFYFCVKKKKIKKEKIGVISFLPNSLS
jgi:hypothetical protein